MTTLTVEPIGTGTPEEDEIERKIIDIATEVANEARTDPEKYKRNPAWNKALFERLGKLGKEEGCCVHGRYCGGRGEWLFDHVWVKERDGKLLSVPLILESEWTWKDIDHDFKKLLVGKAEHRVMISGVEKGENPDHHFKSFTEQVQDFGLTKAEDRYLFLCFDKNDETFKFRVCRGRDHNGAEGKRK